jgi:hypothetical protein
MKDIQFEGHGKSIVHRMTRETLLDFLDLKGMSFLTKMTFISNMFLSLLDWFLDFSCL